MKMKRYISIFKEQWLSFKFKDLKDKLEEELRFSDLATSAGMSDFTKKFRKERNKLLAPENKLAVLSDVIINKKQGHVTFIFYTSPTYEDKMPTTNPKSKFKPTEDTHYEMKFRILDFFKWAKTKPNYQSTKKMTMKELKEILEVAYIQVFCNCMSYHWQGMNYNLSQFDASIFPTNIPPDHWSPNFHFDDQFLCKHLGGLINQWKFFINPMASMLTSKLRKTL